MSEMIKTAVISADKKYRYELRRVWDESKEKILFICLNPSIADAETDDPTLNRIVNFSKSWGFGGVVLVNLFALRSTDASALTTETDPVGPENDAHIKKLLQEFETVVCAWGGMGNLNSRDSEVLSWIENPYCIAKLKSGHPAHPLYQSADKMYEPFN